MGDRLAYNTRIDEDQFAELDRQHDTDEEHDRSIAELSEWLSELSNRVADLERSVAEHPQQPDLIAGRMTKRSKELAGVAGVATIGASAFLAALLKKRK